MGYVGRVIINPLSLTISKVNPSDKLLLVGSIYMTSAAVAVWTMNNSTTALNELSPLTPTQVVIPSRSNYTLNLVLPPNSLIGGLIYTFRLQCSGMTAMVQVSTNAPPSSGNFSVSPLTGSELKTSFEFLASYWMDGDLPISYQFGFSSDIGNSIVQDKSLASKGDSPLPAGHSSFGYQVVCYVKVFDRLNAYSFKYFRVVVNMVDETELSDLITRRVANASVSQLIQTISVVSFTLNSVSCFNSPNCFARNRQNCSTVRDTCGSCYPGFIGEDGSHNSHCSSENDLSRIVNIGVGNTVCRKDDDCTNNLQVCDKIKGKCVHPPKACPNLCSSNGNCTFVNINSGAIVTDCSVLSSDCTAICKCSKEYGGLDCSLTSKKLREKQKLWHQLLVKLSEITISGNTNSNRRVLCGNCSNSNSNSALESWTVSLSSLTQKPSEISPSSSSIITSVIESILTQSIAMGQSYGGISNILDSINTEAELSKEQEKLSTSLKSQLQQFNSLVANQIVVGQSSVENIKSSFRTSVSVVDSSSLQNITISLPVSTLEKTLSSYQPNSVNFYSNEMTKSFDTSSAVKVSVTEVASKMYTNMIVTLYNIGVNEQPFDMIPVNFTTVCRNGKSLNGKYNFTCPNSGRFLNHNCTQTDGVYISYCPVLRPTCHVLDSTSKINNCKVVEYSSIFTKCSCSFLISHGRRISADSNGLLQSSGVLSIASMSEYVGNEFVDSFAASGDFLTAKGLENSLTLIIMFIVIWVGGVTLILTCAWRRRRMLSKNEKDIEQLKRKAQSAKISRSPAAIFNSLQLYISEIFPSVFGNESRIHRMISEIKKHHRYLNIFTASHGGIGDRSRFLTGIQLLTVQTLLIFLLSLFYDLQGPDNDGSCVTFTSATTCLARKSYLDPRQTYCLWTTPSSDSAAANTQYPCNFQDPSFSFQIIAYIAIIVALITALFLKPIDMIFEFLSAPLADSVKVKTAESTIKRVGRRISNAARRLSVSIANTTESMVNRIRREKSNVSVVGSKTRLIPTSTQAAQLMAQSSMTLVAPIADKRIKSQESRKQSLKSDLNKSIFSNQIEENLDLVEDNEINKSEVVVLSDFAKTSVMNLSVDEAFIHLSSDISHQRRLLKPSEVDAFDNQWGIDPTGEFSKDDRNMTLICRKTHKDAVLNIKSEMKRVKSKTTEKIEKLSFATDEHTGLEIMHLFILDLLGRETPAARIFEVKLEEDFRHTRLVTMTTRVICYGLLILMNGFFMYYSILRGYLKGIEYQNVFLLACISQMLVEIFLFETIECVWIQFIVPNMASEEVQRVSVLLNDTVAELCIHDEKFEEKHLVLNAPDYLFVSTNVAKEFPHIMESLIVLSYHSCLPGEISRKWQLGATARIQRHHSLGHTTLFSTVLIVLQVLATLPFLFQRMFIRVTQPFILIGLIYLGTLIIDNVIYTVIASLIVVLIAVSMIYLYIRSRNKLKINPILPSEEVMKVVENLDDNEIVFVENMYADNEEKSQENVVSESQLSVQTRQSRSDRRSKRSCSDNNSSLNSFESLHFSSEIDNNDEVSDDNNNQNSDHSCSYDSQFDNSSESYDISTNQSTTLSTSK